MPSKKDPLNATRPELSQGERQRLACRSLVEASEAQNAALLARELRTSQTGTVEDLTLRLTRLRPMRNHCWAGLLLLVAPVIVRADSYTLINFDDRPPANIGPAPEGVGEMTLVYPQATFYGGVLVADGVSYFDIYDNGYDASQATPPYHNSYQTFDLNPGRSPSDFFEIALSSPVNEIDFGIFVSNFVGSDSLRIDVSNSAGVLLAGSTEGFEGTHFDAHADGISDVYIFGSSPGYYMGIDNVELNAYAKNTPSPVPEPPAYLLLGTGGLLLGMLRRKLRLP